MIPRRLTEIALLKIRNYLRKGGNKEYVVRRLAPQLQGRELGLKDQFNRILMRPLECCKEIEDSGEFSCIFWAHFCVILRGDIKNKKERLPEDIAAVQSACIIDTVNSYYKALAIKRREMELAFKSLEAQLAKPPFNYTLEQMCKFTNGKGILLLTQYSNADLEAWVKRKTTESKDNALPSLLIVRGSGDERFFVLKENMPALCVRLMTIARPKVKDALTKHWRSLLLEFRSEPAMENNSDFENTLLSLSKKHCPLMVTLFDDPKLSLVYDEAEQSESGVPAPARIFTRGQLLPYSSLLLIQRRELLLGIKLSIPIWYSLPIIGSIIAFFKNLSRKKKANKSSPSDLEDAGEEIVDSKDRSGEIRAAARNLETVLVPPGHNMESYMEELESRWSKLIDKQARENLIEDVRSLLRDNLRRTLRIKKYFRLTRESIREMAQNIITRTPSLAMISGRDSLVLYAELYLIKLMGNMKL